MKHLLFILSLSFLSYTVNAQKISALPIKPTRTISFTTDEGSYMNVDVSPDGKTILFDLLGDIYSMPANGGKAKQLTRGLALNAYPIWSPDGKYFAYCSDASGSYELHVRDIRNKLDKGISRNEGGRDPIEPRWNNDCRSIIAGDFSYFLAGGKLPQTEIAKNTITILDNEANLLYHVRTKNGTSICRLNKSSNKSDTILSLTHKQGAANFRLSPDKQWVAYLSLGQSVSKSLTVLDIKTGKSRELLQIDLPFTWQFGKTHYSFSPDSRFIYVAYKGKIHRIEIATGQSTIIPFSADVKVDMGALNNNQYKLSLDSFNVLYCRSAQMRPDKKQVVFSALNKIYIKDLPNGKPYPLVKQSMAQYHPVYSADGKWIAYVTWSDSTGGQLWRVSFDGKRPEQISNVPGLYMNPSWSADENSIAFLKGAPKSGPRRGDPGEGQVQVVNILNRSVRIMDSFVSMYSHPAFSADGNRITYTPKLPKQEKGQPPTAPAQLISQSILFGDKETLAVGFNPSDYIESILRQIKLSPDGRYIIYSYKENLYLVPLLKTLLPVVIRDTSQGLPVIRFAEGGIDPNWEEGGKVIGWTSANKYCRVSVDKIIDNATKLAFQQSNGPSHYEIIAPVAPDEIISLNLKAPTLHCNVVTVLKNARLVTMRGKEIIDNGTIIIKNGRFVSVNKGNSVPVPKDANVYDLAGKTIIPGFVDMHSHMYFVPPDVFPNQSWEFITNLAYGVTTSRDPSGSFDTYGYSELVRTGQMMGPRLFTVSTSVRGDNYDIRNQYEADVIVRNRARMGGMDIKQYGQDTRLQRQLLLLAGRKQGLNMTNEVIKEPLGFLGMLKDGSTGVEHNPVFEDARKDIIQLVAKSGTYLTPTFTVSYQGEHGGAYFHALYKQNPDVRLKNYTPQWAIENMLRDSKPSSMDQPDIVHLAKINEAIFRAGGLIVAGSHGNDEGIGMHHEIWGLTMGGLTPHEALQCATINGAKALGMDKDLGSIEVGKIADLIILDKNPLDDIHNTTSIKYVMKDGILYDAENMDQIWPVYKKCPPFKFKATGFPEAKN